MWYPQALSSPPFSYCPFNYFITELQVILEAPCGFDSSRPFTTASHSFLDKHNFPSRFGAPPDCLTHNLGISCPSIKLMSGMQAVEFVMVAYEPCTNDGSVPAPNNSMNLRPIIQFTPKLLTISITYGIPEQYPNSR